MKKIKYLLWVIVLVVFYSIVSFLFPPLIDKTQGFLSPISKGSRFILAWLYFPSFYKKYNELKKEKLDLTFYKYYITCLKKENEQLRDLLHMPKKRDFQQVFADVIAEPVGRKDFFYIDVGKDKNIKSGYGVILPGYVVCGRVLEVYSHSAKVAYPWNINFSVCAIDEASQEEGILTGGGYLSLDFHFLASDALIEKGDVLRTSTLSNFFPEACLIGEIKEFKCSPNTEQCKAKVVPCIKGMIFYRVVVLIPKKQVDS